MQVSTSNSIRQKVNKQLKECKEKINSCPEHQKFMKLQQAALLCRLFQKQVIIDHETPDGMKRIKALVSLSTPKMVVLQDGTFIAIESIKNIDIV
jgi:hypothetical protein